MGDESAFAWRSHSRYRSPGSSPVEVHGGIGLI